MIKIIEELKSLHRKNNSDYFPNLIQTIVFVAMIILYFIAVITESTPVGLYFFIGFYSIPIMQTVILILIDKDRGYQPSGYEPKGKSIIRLNKGLWSFLENFGKKNRLIKGALVACQRAYLFSAFLTIIWWYLSPNNSRCEVFFVACLFSTYIVGLADKTFEMYNKSVIEKVNARAVAKTAEAKD